MTNYVLLFSGGGMPETEEEQAATLAAWGVWYGELGGAVVDGGNPFTPMVKTVNPDGSVVAGVDGAPATGYTIVAADSFDAAVAMAKGCPILADGGRVHVYEAIVMEM